MSPLDDIQLDALAELANIASGTAATALSQMVGREIGLSVPRAYALPLADAVDAVGDPAQTVTAVAIPLLGDITGAVLLIVDEPSAAALCGLLGVDRDTELGDSALAEITNILTAAYLNAIGTVTGQELLPCPPHASTDMLGAIVTSMLAQTAAREDLALLLDSELDIAGERCAITFMLFSESDSIDRLLAPLGLAGARDV